MEHITTLQWCTLLKQPSAMYVISDYYWEDVCTKGCHISRLDVPVMLGR